MNADHILTRSGHEDSMDAGKQGSNLPKLGPVLKILARILGALVLLAMALFCVFGFFASFEPGNGLIWKVGYAALGCGFLVGAVALALGGRKHGAERDEGLNP